MAKIYAKVEDVPKELIDQSIEQSRVALKGLVFRKGYRTQNSTPPPKLDIPAPVKKKRKSGGK